MNLQLRLISKFLDLIQAFKISVHNFIRNRIIAARLKRVDATTYDYRCGNSDCALKPYCKARMIKGFTHPPYVCLCGSDANWIIPLQKRYGIDTNFVDELKEYENRQEGR